jgi:hypothetical protein
MREFRYLDRGGVGGSVLAGLETGVLGGVCVILYHALGSLLAGQNVWSVPARLAAAAFGRGVYREGLTVAALTGVSLEVFSAGLIGVVFAMAVRPPWAIERVALLGPIMGLSWYYLGYEILLRRFGPGPFAIAPRRSQVLAHLLFGLFLGLYPRFRRSLERTGDTPG